LGEGSYGTVFMAIDTKPKEIKQKIDSELSSMYDQEDARRNNYSNENTDQEMKP
jgi:hypothetical protein